MQSDVIFLYSMVNMASHDPASYESLYKAFRNAFAHTSFSAHQIQEATNKFWNAVKRKDDCSELVKQKILELTKKKMKMDANLLTFWAKVFNHL
jgi:predicted nucleic acid-binding protein